MKAYILDSITLSITYTNVSPLGGDGRTFTSDMCPERLLHLGLNVFLDKEICLKAWKSFKQSAIMRAKSEIVKLEQLQPKIDEI